MNPIKMYEKWLFSTLPHRVEGIANPCVLSNCPSEKKHHILRMLCSNRRLLLPAAKREKKNGLDSWKEIKNLIPSLGKIEKKSKYYKQLLMFHWKRSMHLLPNDQARRFRRVY